MCTPVSRGVRGYIVFGEMYVTGMMNLFRPQKVYKLLIGITSRVNVVMSVCLCEHVRRESLLCADKPPKNCGSYGCNAKI